MAFEADFIFPFEATGAIEIGLGTTPVMLGELFNGVPQLYAGSNFTVEEILEFGTLITKPEVIDVDFRWLPPKKYLGTWTIFDLTSSEGVNPEDRGFIEDFTTKLKRYSTFFIQGNANVPIAEFEGGAIDNCNFALTEVGIEIPPLAGSINTLLINDAVLKYRHTLQRVPLLDREFFPKIRNVGLHIDAGAGLTFAKYRARVINGVSVDLPAFPNTVCTLPGGQIITCEISYQNFIQDNYSAALGNSIFLTQGDAQSYADSQELVVGTYIIYPEQYTCPFAPNTVYTYYELR